VKRAREIGIKGRSTMSKAELVKALRKAAAVVLSLLWHRALARCGQEGEEGTDPVAVLGWVPEQAVGVDRVPGASAGASASDVAGGFQVGDDGLDGSFGQVGGGAEVPDPGVGVAGDLHEHMAVPGQERPAAAAITGIAHPSDCISREMIGTR
jgi:hypothetical protein